MKEDFSENIEKKLKDHFGSFTIDPDISLWASIEQKLEKENHKRRRRYFSNVFISLSLCLILFSMPVFLVKDNGDEKKISESKLDVASKSLIAVDNNILNNSAEIKKCIESSEVQVNKLFQKKNILEAALKLEEIIEFSTEKEILVKGKQENSKNSKLGGEVIYNGKSLIVSKRSKFKTKTLSKSFSEDFKRINKGMVLPSGIFKKEFNNLNSNHPLNLLAINKQIEYTDDKGNRIIIKPDTADFSSNIEEVNKAKENYLFNMKPSLSLFFTPMYPNASAINKGDLFNKDRIEKSDAANGFSFGFKFLLPNNKNFFTATGIGFTHYNHKVKSFTDKAFNRVDTVATYKIVDKQIGYDVNNNPIYKRDTLMTMVIRDTISYEKVLTEYSTNYNYLTIPLHINYVLNPRGRLTYLIGAGVDFNIFMQGNTIAREGASFYVIKNYSILDKEKPFNAVLFSGIGSIGVNYRLSNHLSLFVNSKLNYSLNSVYKSNYLIRYKPVSYGIESGINIKF